MLTPLWASYLVKAFAWRAWSRRAACSSPPSAGRPGFGLTAVVITLAYLWLPFMVLPIYAGFERLPDSLLEASSDLGARPGRTLRSVALPMIVPSLIAGSIFTFSLSLGDYITVKNVGGKTQMLGNLVFDRQATDIPFAAALATVSVVIMVSISRWFGAPARWRTCEHAAGLQCLAGQPLGAARRSWRRCCAFVYVPLACRASTRSTPTRPSRGRRRASRWSGGRRRANSSRHDRRAAAERRRSGCDRHGRRTRARHAWRRSPCSATASSASRRCRC